MTDVALVSRKRSLVAATIVAALASAALPAVAQASQLIDRNAKGVKLEVSRSGQALLTYRTNGKLRRVLAWGAINALAPIQARPQVRFKVDYSGGWGTYRRDVWRTFANVCRRYDGPKLAWFVAGCKAPDGSYWAVQSWQPMLSIYGTRPWKRSQTVRWLLLSHWSGPIAKLEAGTDWIWGGRYHRVFGRLTYRGKPVHGFEDNRFGAPLDGYGRVVYLDTYNSAYGRGWKRENGFLTHRPNGNFCYGLYEHEQMPGYSRGGRRPPGNGARYRLTVQGPGVTPDVMWQGKGLPAFDARNPEHELIESEMHALNDRLRGGDRLCKRR